MSEVHENSAPGREGMVARAVDWLFGHDFFLSYSHKDGKHLPRSLKQRLEQAGFRVFLDQTDYVAGMDLHRETRRQVVKSRRIVVVGRPYALDSKWVRREVDVALNHGKEPVIVDVNRAVMNAPADAVVAKLVRARDWLRLEESLADPDGDTSDFLVAELVRGFTYVRQITRRQRVLVAVALTLAAISAIATWQAYEARRQRAVAVRNFAIARESADGLVTDLARKLRHVQGMSVSATREILGRAAAAYTQLADAAPQDPIVLAGQVAMYAEFVETYLAASDLESATKAAEQGLELAARLVERDGGSAASRRALALAEIKRGDVHEDRREFAEARSRHSRALSMREKLAAELPEDPVAQRDVAVVLARLGTIDATEGDHAAARSHFERSLELRRPLVTKRPEWRRDLVVLQVAICEVYRVLEDLDRARNAADEAVQISELLIRERPDDKRDLRNHAVALQYRGNVALDEQDWGRARSAFEKSQANFEKLRDMDPEDLELSRDVGVAISKRAEVERRAGDAARMQKLLGDTIELRRALVEQRPDNRLFQVDLAEALKDLGLLSSCDQGSEALREARQLLGSLDAESALSPEQQEWMGTIDRVCRPDAT